MRQSTDKYIIRMPQGMRDRIRDNAAANRRSMNAEIVHYLDEALGASQKNGAAGAATPPRLDQTTTHHETGEK